VTVANDALSPNECDEIIQKHEARLKELKSREPIICFNSKAALSSHMEKLDRSWASKVIDTMKALKEGLLN